MGVTTIDLREGHLRSGFCRVLASFVAVLALAMVFPYLATESAGAAVAPEELLYSPEFGSDPPEGSAGDVGQGSNGVETDPDTGHYFVAEPANLRVSEFTSWGVFVKAFGWGVRNGADELQTCGPQALPPSTCQAGTMGSGAGQFGTDGANGLGIAMDSAGDLYVWERDNDRVQKFSQSGEFLLMFGGGVNKTTGADVCTRADLEGGGECGAGSVGTAPGEFSTNAVGTFIDVGPGDVVHVADVGRVQRFSSSGVFLDELAIPNAPGVKLIFENLVVDAGGNIYITERHHFANEFGRQDIRKYSPTGELIATLDVYTPDAMAFDSAGNLLVTVPSPSQPFGGPQEVLMLDPSSGACLICPGSGVRAPGAATIESLATNVLGDGTSTPGDIYLGLEHRIGIFGPIPRFEPPPERPPAIQDQFAAEVGTDRASLRAVINPRFFQGTTYYLEYGTGECSAGGCATAPAPPGASLGGERNKGVETEAIKLTGLVPGTTYNYRFVAISGSSTTKGVGETEAEGSFTTRRVASSALPDGRAYEMVSPVDKESGEVGMPTAAGGLVNFSVEAEQAAPSGDGITYQSFTAFGDDPESAPGGASTSRAAPQMAGRPTTSPRWTGGATCAARCAASRKTSPGG